MGDTSLPDEIISEILSPALKVPDDAFSNTSSATFAKYTESTSGYLVVCKSWLRVATPLLYNVVILRSKAQAKALSNALTTASKKNDDLGRFIKKLRVEGGYGSSMHAILKLSPNITHIFLSLEILSPDTTEGLCKGLKLISPTRLILRDTSAFRKSPQNKSVVSLIDTLVAVIPKWERLTSFDYPYEFASNRTTKIVTALANCRRLQTLFVDSPRAAETAYKVFDSCPLRVVHVKGAKTSYTMHGADPKLASILRYRDRTAENALQILESIEIATIAPSLDPFFVPMKDASPEVQDIVWSRVLYFAMRCPERATELQQHRYLLSSSPRVPFLLVSKGFLRLGLPHFYETVFLDWGRNAEGIALDDQRERRIQTFMCFTPISIRFLTNLFRCSAASLVEVRVYLSEETGPPLPANLLSFLTVLRKLRLDGYVTVTSAEDVDPEALAHLEELIVRQATTSLITLLERTRLPCLHTMNITFWKAESLPDPTIDVLLATHGEKLKTLALPTDILARLGGKALDFCPNLITFSIISSRDGRVPPAPSPNVFSPQTPVTTLTHIIFDIALWPLGRTQKSRAIAVWDTFFAKFDPTLSLPNMRQVTFNCFQWPTNERDIAKSCWVRWAEALVSELTVVMVDREGKKWRPRLKVGGR
ncbi:hypothetical protein C8F01DRAFT_1053761 [Mycena amicta]|nr:hypothetical protein C8F01DRAFT_1053761 [Mycena amicta]